MTVEELIKELSTYDGNLPVSLGYDGRDPIVRTVLSYGTHDEGVLVCFQVDKDGLREDFDNETL